jgi:hypothetical protein
MGMAEAFPMRDSKGGLWRGTSGGGNKSRPSEGELADRLAERHCREVRFLTAAARVYRQPARKAGWIVWSETSQEWLADAKNVAQRLAREICREAADTCDDPAIDSNRVVSGVLSLAKCDPRLVVSDWPCHPDIEAAVDAWLADHCVFSPGAWTPRADLLAWFVRWQSFDADDLSIAFDARGLTYRRKGNTPGFDGVRLKGGRDD